MELAEKLHNCSIGDHELIEILKSNGYETDSTARWCRVCGCVVVDLEVDGRLMEPGGYMKMISPQVTEASQIYFGSHED